MKAFDPEQAYAVPGYLMQRVAKITLRLYTEDRLARDEYRDLAQALHSVVDGSFPLEDEEGYET